MLGWLMPQSVLPFVVSLPRILRGLVLRVSNSERESTKPESAIILLADKSRENPSEWFVRSRSGCPGTWKTQTGTYAVLTASGRKAAMTNGKDVTHPGQDAAPSH